jgi:hypothetical protein
MLTLYLAHLKGGVPEPLTLYAAWCNHLAHKVAATSQLPPAAQAAKE